MRIEQEAEFHRFGHRSCGRLQRKQPLLQRGVLCLLEVDPPALDAAMDSIRPEEDVSVNFIAAVTGQRPCDIHECVGVQRNVLEWNGDITAAGLDIEQRRGNILEVLFQLPPQDGRCTQFSRERLQRLARQIHSVANAGSERTRRSRVTPLAHRVSYSNKVCGEVAAVHRGHVARLPMAGDRGCRTSCRSGRDSAASDSLSGALLASAPPLRWFQSSQSPGR